jgi:hypothetical protein
LAGVIVLLAPAPARLKEWAYAGFAITLGSALIAHFAVGDGPEKWVWAAGTAVLWAVSYGLWRLLQADHTSQRSSEGTSNRTSKRERVHRYQPA